MLRGLACSRTLSFDVTLQRFRGEQTVIFSSGRGLDLEAARLSAGVRRGSLRRYLFICRCIFPSHSSGSDSRGTDGTGPPGSSLDANVYGHSNEEFLINLPGVQ